MTNKQRVFIEEYLKCWNATEAARRAGYKGNDTTLRVVGSENLAKPYIKQEIEARIKDRAMEADEVLSSLAEIARHDIGDFLTFYDGVKEPFLDLNKAREAQKLGLIKKFKYNQGNRLEVEFYDKQAALVQLGKHLGLFVDKVEHTGEIAHTVKVIKGVSIDDL